MSRGDWFPTFRKLADTRWPLSGMSSTPFRTWWPLFSTATQQQSLLRLIAVGTEENLPLIPLLETWAADEFGVQRRRLHRLLNLMKAGASLPQALEQIPGLIRNEDLVAMRFDAQLGTRTAAVRQLLTEPTRQAHRSRTQQTLLYLGFLLLFCGVQFVFMQLRIVPVFEHILHHNALPRPEIMAWSAQFAAIATRLWIVAVPVALVLLFLLLSGRLARIVRYSFAGSWYRPYQQSLAADVLTKLGVALDAGRPLTSALSTLARYYFDPTMRHKLLFVRNEVEQGAEVWQSLNHAGLLTAPEVRVLHAAERVGNRPWVLEQLVLGKRRRTTQQLERASEFLMPVIVVGVGCFVLFQALTVFVPLTELVNSLSTSVP